jgi:serine protease Do
MRFPCVRVAVCAAVGLLFTAPAFAQYSRRTPIVEAVEKTSGAILTLKIEKRANFGRISDVVGTGVIVDERGYAVTNRHVIQQAGKISAFLSGGSSVGVAVVHEDPTNDLAILKLEGDRLYQAMPVGPSSDLMVGETVIAVGNPYGYSNTVSRGIVSALGRQITIPGGSTLQGLIQIDAPINPGSSGGPLININGELIGVNVAMRDGAQGIGFAIPSETIKQVLSSNLSAKKLSGVDHGLACRERVEPEGTDRQKVVVDSLDRRGLAANAGLQAGDQLVQVAGRVVSNRFDVERALWDAKPGQTVRFHVDRLGQKVEVIITLPERSLAASRP